MLLSRAQCSLRRLAGLLLLAGLLTLSSPAAGLEPPPFRGYVNDYAQLLQPDTRLLLEQTLRNFEDTDSTQVAVLILDSLEGDAVEDFSIRTVERWKIGQKGKDNGVLLLVVKSERKLRIEVGRGLEGALTDLVAGRIVDTVMRPLFKAGRFDDGVKAGVAAIIEASRGEFTAPPRPARRGQSQGAPPALAYVLFGLMFLAFLGRLSRPLGIGAGALLLPLAAFIGLPSLGWLLLLLLVPAGALVGLVLPFFLGNLLFRGGGFGGFGGFGGGGLGGDGGGFGGFGGGDFGGGGASGDW